MRKDIFASVSGKEPFELCEDRIKLYDFEDNYYEIDFWGIILTDWKPRDRMRNGN